MDTMSHCSSSMSDSEGKSSAELRKQNKPLMEKRRRARINDSLNKLKSLVLDAMKRDTSRYSKLEKADILEMTVKHLRSVQRQQMAAAMASDTTVISKYRAGFVECASEVTRYLSSIDGLDPAVRSRLMSHLSSCTQKVTTMSAMQEAHTSQQQQLMQPMRVQIPQATPMTALPGYATPTSATGGFLLSATASPASTTSTPPPPPPQSSTRGLHHMSVPGGQFALLVPATDGGYALSSTAHASLYATGSGDVVNAASRSQAQAQAEAHFLHGQQLRCFGGSMSSSSATSPGMTSPMSVTSDRVFRYGSASDVSSSDEDDVVDVALDMRVEPCRDVTNTRRGVSDVTNNPCRDVNANIIKPGGSQVEYQFRRGVTSPTTGSAHTAPRPEVRVVDDMWRPW